MERQMTLEERVAVLERELAALKRQPPASEKAGWVGRVIGSMDDYPEFKEVVRLGREFRRSQWPEDESESP